MSACEKDAQWEWARGLLQEKLTFEVFKRTLTVLHLQYDEATAKELFAR